MSEKDNPDFLDDFANSEAPNEPQDTPENPAPAAPEEPASGEKGETPETPVPEAPPAPESDKGSSVPIAALMAERDKRQRLERELEEFRKKQEQQPEPEKPDFYTDPQRYVQDAVTQAEQAANNRILAAFAAHARTLHQDYDEVLDEVKAYAADHPAVANEIMSDANPALAAYQFGKKLRAHKEIGDPEAFKAKVEAELRAKWEAELAAKEEAKRKAADAIPPDLSTARSPATGGTPAGDPFDELFPRN